jgi:hypothetical protein
VLSLSRTGGFKMVKLRDAVPGLIVVGIAVGFVAMLALLGPTESKTSRGLSSASISVIR